MATQTPVGHGVLAWSWTKSALEGLLRHNKGNTITLAVDYGYSFNTLVDPIPPKKDNQKRNGSHNNHSLLTMQLRCTMAK